MTDTVVEEVRAIRAKIAEECGYDLKKIIEHSHVTARRIAASRYISEDKLKRRTQRAVPDATSPVNERQ